MKFGGSSVEDITKIKKVAERVIATKKSGKKVIVVLSAPGDMTDKLISRAYEVTDNPDSRELDMLVTTGEQISIALLAMAIKSKGYSAISLTGPQAGIYTDSLYTKARIINIKPKKILTEINKGNIVIVAGFQGVSPYDDITTLGRGGSDLTAVALASVFKADKCEIYTDVPGIFTADPRICPEARKLNSVSFDEMLEMAGSGAQVIQGRAIEVAKKFNIVFEIKSAFENIPGTKIVKEDKVIEKPIISSVVYDKNQAKLSILDVPDKPGIAAKVFTALAKENINVDMIVQSAARDGWNDISFTVTRNELRKALQALDKVKKSIRVKGIIYDEKISKVSIVGVGMKSHPGVAAKMFSVLAENNINIEMISTSEIKISCIIKQDKTEKAVNVLHKAFISGR